MAEQNYTEEEIKLTMIAHDCTREEAISTHCASVRASREEQRPILELQQLREVRNRMITQTDWWAGADLTMTQEQKDYRQALRDITKTYKSVRDVVWPTPPS
tara:strand:+ start:998 stop:1303 length:306 start_codon:yes stop_codon:yes gene_type:complete